MLQFVRLIFIFFLIVFLSLQTRKENLLLEKFYESGFFITYSEAKNFLGFFTWISIVLFLGFSAF